MGPSEAAIKPNLIPLPVGPTATERALHEITHLPYRSWCKHCVAGKGKQTPHRHGASHLPVVQIDHAFTTIPEEDVRATVLTAIDVRTQMCMAAIVPSKGATPYAIAELKRFLFECGRTYAVLQCDGESSVKVVSQGIAKDLGGISLRYALVGSSESQLNDYTKLSSPRYVS